MDADGFVKITDFGLCKEGESANAWFTTQCFLVMDAALSHWFAPDACRYWSRRPNLHLLRDSGVLGPGGPDGRQLHPGGGLVGDGCPHLRDAGGRGEVQLLFLFILRPPFPAQV